MKAKLLGIFLMAVLQVGTMAAQHGHSNQSATKAATKYDWKPDASNKPIGDAKGIYRGRVSWAHMPGVAHWAGDWKSMENSWWSDQSTDQDGVNAMLGAIIRSLSGQNKYEEAWQAIFKYHNKTLSRNNVGYKKGEIVAIKLNMNGTFRITRHTNATDTSPQMVYAMIEQLVKYGGVDAKDIVVYDAKRDIYPEILMKVWSDYKDVRFLQSKEPGEEQKHPYYGEFRNIETPQWVQAIEYSNGKYDRARNIPKQIKDATYLINLALLKAHSYPYSNQEKGDEGQTAVTMIGKSHYGTIQQPDELHAIINTNKEGVAKAFSPMIDMAASSELGAKSILYILEGLYCARKHNSNPVHFPNAPFNNKVYPYANPEWPSSILGSLDMVALDSVGLDILYSQSQNNKDPENDNRPSILIRENADDYLHEMALAGDNPPSGAVYMQGGKKVESLGVHEHWNNDHDRQYSRNLDPKNGRGIELVYMKL